ncbi:MAG: metallophosphoesterase, partial [Candidatus Cloacimonadota bacterium]|nr:metallophosphoesterase [Candidatus Cloacimonadota bacterium]
MFNKTCMVVMLLISTIIFANEKQMKLNGADGPYIYHENGNLRVVSVDSLNKITDTITTKDTFVCEVENEDRDSFTFKLQNEFAITPSHYEKPKKMLAISDIEGNFNAFYSLLISNKVIDNNLNWVYGAGHLVLVGDFVDRGENVTQCLWLIYKLDYQSKQAGGQVHFILGNHEVMTFKARTRYIAEKYIALAQQVFAKEDNKLAYKELFSRNSELIRWMKTKNFIEKIGDVIFVHAGLSSDIMNKEMSF